MSERSTTRIEEVPELVGRECIIYCGDQEFEAQIFKKPEIGSPLFYTVPVKGKKETTYVSKSSVSLIKFIEMTDDFSWSLELSDGRVYKITLKRKPVTDKEVSHHFRTNNSGSKGVIDWLRKALSQIIR